MPEHETWYHAQGGQSIGPLNGQQMEMLAQTGQITRETLVWPGSGEWVAAGSTRLAGFFAQVPGIDPGSPVTPPRRTPNSRAAFLKDKPRLRVALQIVVMLLGLYAMYSGFGQMREGFGELRDAPDANPSTETAQIYLQGCRGVSADAVQCSYQNNGRVQAKMCMDVVVFCDDGRHVASSCSDPIPPGQPSTKLIDGFTPAVSPTNTCSNIQYENVKVL